MTPELGLGDLLRAWEACRRDLDALPVLVRLLGSEPAPAVSAAAQIERTELPGRSSTGDVRKTHGRGAESEVIKHAIAVVLEPLPPAPTPPVPAWHTASPLKRATLAPRPPSPPLFPPLRERALLAATARTMRDDGGIDVVAVVDAIAHLRLPRPLPRTRTPSLRGGAQLVIDAGPWMAPFTEDAAHLRSRLREVVGESLEELLVPALPPLVRSPDAPDPRAWMPPRPRTAIVVVSDLGRVAERQGRTGGTTAWMAFLADMEAAGFAPIVLVPGRGASYPRGRLRRTLLLGWDRRARVLEIAQFVRDRW
jgi:hypothetical protein